MTDAMINPLPRPPRRPVSLDTLEAEVQDALKRQQIGQAVEHVGEKDVGRLSAEAVLSQYERAAKAIESMGDDMKVSIANLEAAMVEADAAMKAVTELAATIREKGKLHQVQVEQATLMAKDITDACVEFRRKVGA